MRIYLCLRGAGEVCLRGVCVGVWEEVCVGLCKECVGVCIADIEFKISYSNLKMKLNVY